MSIPTATYKPGTAPKTSVASMLKEVPYFAEKRILVTGASSGIGRAVATWYSIFVNK